MAQNVDKFREYGQAALCRLNNVRKVQFVKQIGLSLSLSCKAPPGEVSLNMTGQMGQTGHLIWTVLPFLTYHTIIVTYVLSLCGHHQSLLRFPSDCPVNIILLSLVRNHLIILLLCL